MSTYILPPEVLQHLPDGYREDPGIWLVLPEPKLKEMQIWIRAEDWYPDELQKIVWYGEDGTGNIFGWDPDAHHAILWNPEDGSSPWKIGAVTELWQFVRNGYRD
ncbi:hypothetical protein [Burkholderia stagnalis]